MTNNKEEFEVLRDILISKNYAPSIPIGTLKEMMDNAAEETDYKCGWRISESRGIAWNESVEHWKDYYSDILMIDENGDLVFIE